MLISAVTHPWPGGIAWYYNASSIPVVRALLAKTLAWPFGSLAIETASRGVFAPAAMPADYVDRAAIKLVLGIGDPLVGRLLLFDAQTATFTEVALRRDPQCPVCGDDPTITEYIDYVEFCNPVRA